jgi:small subunit ribosomal protein S17
MSNSVTLSQKPTLIGRVISDKMDKTVTVIVTRREKHFLYGKYIEKSKKYHAHDELNTAKVGDTVEIQEVRKLSKTKAWSVSNIVKESVNP